MVVRKAWEWGLEGASLASSGHKQQPGKAGVEGAPSLAEAGAVAEVPGGSLDEAEEEEVGITRSEILGQRRNLLARTGNLHMACVVDTRNNNLVSGWKTTSMGQIFGSMALLCANKTIDFCCVV